jgi:AraC-like DNA-binding protein
LAHDYRAGREIAVAERVLIDHALLYVHAGDGVCTDVHGHPLSAGYLMVVPPEVPHRIELQAPDAVHMYNIHFDPVLRPDSERVTQWQRDPANPRPTAAGFPELAAGQVRVVCLRMPGAYEAAFRRVWRHFPADSELQRIRLRAAMLDLLAHVLAELHPDAVPAIMDPRLEKARRYLAESHGPVTLTAAAAQVGMGRSSFAAAFHAQYGMAPMAWCRAQRIKRAQADLLADCLPIKAVALRWGFCSVAHFTRVFREIVGAPPACWVASVTAADSAKGP